MTRWHVGRGTGLLLILAMLSNVSLAALIAVLLEPTGRANDALVRWGLWLSLAVVGVMALALAGGGVLLADSLDARRDRLHRKSRRSSTRGLSRRSALALAMVLLLAAVAITGSLGPWSTLVMAVSAGAVVVYAMVGRFVPVIGLPVLAVGYVCLLVAVNPLVGFLAPAMLAMTHIIGTGLVRHAVLGVRPRLDRPGAGVVMLCWCFAAVALSTWMASRDGMMLATGPLPGWPMLAVLAVFAGYLVWLRRLANRTDSVPLRLLDHHLVAVAMIVLVALDLAWLIGLGLWVWVWLPIVIILCQIAYLRTRVRSR